MRIFLFSLLILNLWQTSSLKSQQKVSPAQQLINEAQLKASKRGTKVLVIYHASWCVWCKKLDETMQSKELNGLFQDNYEIVHLDVLERNTKKDLEIEGGVQLLEAHGGTKQGLPYWVILDQTGILLADSKLEGKNTGCPVTEEEVRHLVTAIYDTSNISLNGLKTIFEKFRTLDR